MAALVMAAKAATHDNHQRPLTAVIARSPLNR
jgi:hypothetical protein